MHKYLLVTIPVNQLIFAYEKFSRGLQKPQWREYILPYNNTSTSLDKATSQTFIIADYIIQNKSKNKVVTNKSLFTVYNIYEIYHKYKKCMLKNHTIFGFNPLALIIIAEQILQMYCNELINWDDF